MGIPVAGDSGGDCRIGVCIEPGAQPRLVDGDQPLPRRGIIRPPHAFHQAHRRGIHFRVNPQTVIHETGEFTHT